jgi:hypothetical protein
MSSWLLKTAIQKVFGVLPGGNLCNELLQKYVTRTLDLEPNGTFLGRLEACRQHTRYYLAGGQRSIEGAKVVELGTGWFAIIPIGLFLQGASEIWTWDIVRHLRRDTFKRTIELFIQFEESNLLQEFLSDIKPDRLHKLHEVFALTDEKTPHELLEMLHIHALIGDVRRSALEPQSIDFVYSHQVLEHISPQLLSSLFIEFRRLLKRDGVMCHNIGLADQFANTDSSITPFNYLKFSKRQWKLFDNSMIPQNRLRIVDYRELLERAGFSIDEEHNLLGDPDDLSSIQIASEFTRYSVEELLVLYSWFVASPSLACETV